MTTSHQMLTLQALSSSLRCQHCKERGCLAEQRLLGDLRQSVPQNGRIHLLGIEMIVGFFGEPLQMPPQTQRIVRIWCTQVETSCLSSGWLSLVSRGVRQGLFSLCYLRAQLVKVLWQVCPKGQLLPHDSRGALITSDWST